MNIPEVRFARSGDVHIAYQVVGGGPVDLVRIHDWLSNLELQWKLPKYAAFTNDSLRSRVCCSSTSEEADSRIALWTSTSSRSRCGWTTRAEGCPWPLAFIPSDAVRTPDPERLAPGVWKGLSGRVYPYRVGYRRGTS